MLMSILPTYAFAQTAEDVTTGKAVINQSINDKNNMLTLEAYLTSSTIAPEKKVAAPTDIVLVLDQSKSMYEKYDKQSTRQEALQKAVVNFVEKVGEAYSENANHKLAVITFNSNVSTLVGWTAANEAGVNTIKSKVNSLSKVTGATYMAPALQRAGELIANRDETTYLLDNGTELNRKIPVIASTDGYTRIEESDQ